MRRMGEIRGHGTTTLDNAERVAMNLLEENGRAAREAIDYAWIQPLDDFLKSGKLADAPGVKYLEVAARDRSVKSHVRTFVRACQALAEHDFSEVLRWWRAAAGLSVGEVAAQCGVPMKKLKIWLRKEARFTTDMPAEIALRLDDALGANGAVLAAYAATTQDAAFTITPPIMDKILNQMSFGRLLRRCRRGLSKRALLLEVKKRTGITVSESLFSKWECKQLLPSLDNRETVLALDKICGAEGKLAEAWEKEQPRSVKSAYGFSFKDWPEKLRAHYDRIRLYKTTNPEKLPRSKGYGGDRWGIPSQLRFRGFAGRFFGYLLARRGADEKFDASTLSFSLLCRWDLVEEYFRFVQERNGRLNWTGEEKNETKTLLNLYVCFFPKLATDVAGEPHWNGKLPVTKTETVDPILAVTREVPIEALADQWAEQLRLTRERAKLFLGLNKKNFQVRRLNAKIGPLLAAKIGLWRILAELKEQVLRAPLQITSLKAAVRCRKQTETLLLFARSLRPATIRSVSLNEIGNHGVEASIPSDKIKPKGKGGGKGGLQGKLSELPWFSMAMERWIKLGRPYILNLCEGDSDVGSLFTASPLGPKHPRGGPISEKTLADDILSVLGYSPYGQRHLFATSAWIAGLQVKDIANAMHNTPSIAAGTYIDASPEQNKQRGNRVFAALLERGG